MGNIQFEKLKKKSKFFIYYHKNKSYTGIEY